MNKLVAAYTPICEEDAGYISQYLSEIERLNLPFAIHFDRCSNRTKQKIQSHRLCIGFTEQDDLQREFSELDRQQPFDLIAKKRFRWALSMDMDETYEKEAPNKIPTLLERLNVDCAYVNMVTLWNDPQHIRTNGVFDHNNFQVKLYNLGRRRWEFISQVANGPRAVTHARKARIPENYRASLEMKSLSTARLDLVCLHWGFMTDKLRRKHKQRWDRIYTKQSGGNPYRTWDWALDENEIIVIADNPYL